ncbi:MAG: hypothetical protein ACXV8O_05545 [Methylobacter sp.]
MIDVIFLHIGFDKTGSTSIQFTAHDNREYLAQAGVLYPSGTWHPQLGSCFTSNPESYYYNCAEGRIQRSIETLREEDLLYLESLKAEFNHFNGQIAVLSYEGFCSLESEAVLGMRDFLLSLARCVKVIVYCRDPFDYAIGSVSQRASSAAPIWDFVPYQDFSGVLQIYLDAFGKENIIVREFNRTKFPNDDIRFDFFDIVGLSEAQIEQMCSKRESGNSSLSQEAMLIACELANYCDYTTSTDFGLRYGHHLQSIQGSKLTLSDKQFADVEETSRQHLAFLFENFGVQFEPIDRARATFSASGMPKSTIKSIAAVIHQLAKSSETSYFALQESENAYQYTSVSYFQLKSAKLNKSVITEVGGMLTFNCHFGMSVGIEKLEARIYIYDNRRRLAFQTDSSILGKSFSAATAGYYRLTLSVYCDLPDGQYSFGFAFFDISKEDPVQLANYGRYTDFSIAANRMSKSLGYAPLTAKIEFISTGEPGENSVLNDVNGKISILSAPMEAVAGKWFTIEVEVSNMSNSNWVLGTLCPLNIGYHWEDKNGSNIIFDGHRTPLNAEIFEAGQTITQRAAILAPDATGELTLIVTLVQEFVGWLETKGFQPAIQAILVRIEPI